MMYALAGNSSNYHGLLDGMRGTETRRHMEWAHHDIDIHMPNLEGHHSQLSDI
jgi:hypothetical protein